MERLEERGRYNKYGLVRVYTLSNEVPCASHGYYKNLDYNVKNNCFILVQEDEVNTLNFYNSFQLNNLLKHSKMSIEIAGRQLQAGDLVVGYSKYKNFERKLCIGMYIGKKQVYTLDGEVICPEIFLIEPNFMLNDEVELLKRLKMLYTISNEANIVGQANKNNVITPGDIVCTSSKSLYLYLGQYNIYNKCSYVYLNFSINSKKQNNFLDFLKGNQKVNMAIDNYNYSLGKLDISDIKLRGILLSIIGACSGKFLVTDKLKSFSTIVHHLDLDEEERCNLKFQKITDGYMVV